MHKIERDLAPGGKTQHGDSLSLKVNFCQRRGKKQLIPLNKTIASQRTLNLNWYNIATKRNTHTVAEIKDFVFTAQDGR